jgi:hypothetical protein
MIGRSFGTENPIGDTSDMVNHIKSQGGLE